MNRSLDIELGKALPLAKAAPYFGCSPSQLRAMCAAEEVEHVRFTGRNGRINYRIPEPVIWAWRRQHTVTAA